MYKFLIRLEEILSPLFLGLMTLVIIFQVLNRYVFTFSFDWPEELGRYLFLFAVYQGISYAELKDRHLEITLMRTLFKGRFDKMLQITSKIFSIAFCIIMTWWGTKMVLFVKTSEQLTPALQIPMYIIYLCVPIGMVFMLVHTCVNLAKICGSNK